MKSEKVTVYIPGYNIAGYLERVIAGVMRQSYPIEEVLVIDDGSKDDTAARVLEMCGGTRYPLRLVSHAGNKGLAAARNTAFREARGDFVASLDGDCVADERWLAALMAQFSDDAIAGVGGRLIESEIHCSADRWREAHLPQEWGASVLKDPQFLFGHSNVFRRSAVLKTPGYDEKLRTNGEDYSICQSLYSLGYGLVYTPEAIVHHLKTDTTESVLTAVWRYGHWGFKPSALKIVKHALLHLWEGLVFFCSDIRGARWCILPITLAYPCWCIRKDIATWREKRSAAAE